MQRQRQPQTHSPRRETINMLRGVAAGTGAVSDTAQVACCRLQQHHVYSHRFGRASRAEIAQLVARRSHNPKVMSSILTFRMAWRCLVSYALARAVDHCRLGPGPSAFQTDTSRLSRHGHEFLGGLGYPSTAEINKSDHTRSRTWICRGHIATS